MQAAATDDPDLKNFVNKKIKSLKCMNKWASKWKKFKKGDNKEQAERWRKLYLLEMYNRGD
jgi:hypothetical protein